MDLTALTIAAITGLAGAAVITALVVEVIKRALAPTPEQTDRFGPIGAVAVGIVVVTLATLHEGGDPAQGILVGFLAGCVSMGVYQGVKAVAPRVAAPERGEGA